MDELESLKVAFGVDVLRAVAEADGHLDAREIDALARAWPDGTLRRLGFLDDDGLTEAWADAVVRARAVLPERLSEAEKLLLLGFFHTVSLADGELHPTEVQVVQRAARDLGVSIERLSRHLDTLAGITGGAPPVRR